MEGNKWREINGEGNKWREINGGKYMEGNKWGGK